MIEQQVDECLVYNWLNNYKTTPFTHLIVIIINLLSW